MKVIEEKTPCSGWNLKVTCTGKNWRQKNAPCGSILEIDVTDLYKREWFKYPDNEGVNYGFICPICGCFTELEDKLLDENLKMMAKDYLNRNNEKE